MAAEAPSRPTRDDIWIQVEKLLKLPKMRGEMHVEALRWLIREEEKGRFARRERSSCKHVSVDFYRYAQEDLKHEMPGDPVEAGKKLFGDIEDVLSEYYASPAAFGDKVQIKYSGARGRGWEPMYEWYIPTRGRISSQGIGVYPNWTQFESYLDRVTRNEGDELDLKIVAFSFKDGGVPHFKLRELALRGVRIGVLFTNPVTGEALVRTRNLIRHLYDGEKASDELHSLTEQIDRLERMGEDLRRKSCTGSVEVRRSSLMPYAFVAACHQFVILGFFLATQSYAAGPMIVCDTSDNPDLCGPIHKEWDERWKFAGGQLRCEDSAEALAQFFGLRDRAVTGMIVLQADRLGSLMQGWNDEQSQEVLQGKHRAFKARRWVDACDVEGAQAIVDVFVSHQLRPPIMSVCYRGITEPQSYGFEIITGGFTDVTRRDLDWIGGGWLQLRTVDESGDTVLLHRDIPLRPDCVTVEPDEGELVRVLPRGWDSTYMKRWAAHVEAPGGPDIFDYALILRYLDIRSGKVRFFLAGFTEVGTKAAGVYLATKWPELCKNACHDLFTIIWGPSDPNRVHLWTPVVTKTFDELRTLGVLKT